MKNKIGKLLIILFCLTLLLNACRCSCSSSRIIIGKKAPIFKTANDIMVRLDTILPPNVSKFDKALGFWTVGFKRAGIFGWKDLKYEAQINGVVQQCKKSTDGFLTVDVKINEVKIDSIFAKFDNKKYIRVEICLTVIKIEEPILIGNEIIISGKLMWDGDGFLEIHPEKSTDIIMVKK